MLIFMLLTSVLFDLTQKNAKIESLNCRGLRDLKKRLDFFDDFKKRGINIINLRETHLISKDLVMLKKIGTVNS